MLFGVKFQETYLAVDLFFMLSGVVIAHAYDVRLTSTLKVRQFLWLRVARIYPLYLLGVLILLGTFLSGITTRVSWIEYGSLPAMIGCALLVLPYLGTGSYLITPLNPPGWSLIFELAANGAYALILRWLNARMLIAILVFSAAGLLALALLRHDHTIDMGWHTKTFLGGFFRVAYPFFAGVFLQRRFAAKKQLRSAHRTVSPAARWIPWLLLTVLVAITTAAPGPAIRPWYEWLVIVTVFPALIYAAMHCEPGARTARLFNTLGILSYAVYAVHYPLTFLLMSIWERATGLSVENFAPWGGFVLLAILLPLCWWLVPNYDQPMRRRLLSWFKEDKPAVVDVMPNVAVVKPNK
jgi:peptidoglycan/LPS O-acetylase OafA/YrhL